MRFSAKLRLVAGIAVAGGLAWQLNPNLLAGDRPFSSAVGGVVRSSRAIYTVLSLLFYL